ncbi:hypothetical protein PG996_003349 [Apiospora saccharicola]|uniref:Cyanovirin-N domain-containing protein n=1 Tax=Apiospora saccharicola TaxID=335842 RepID=A0ABR1W4U8_9PEZI
MSPVNRLCLLLVFLFSALVSAESYLKYCNNFNIMVSQKVQNKVFLKADCLGVYGNTTQTQCSYLDLNQCYTLNKNTKQYQKQRLGKAFYLDDNPDRGSWCRTTYADANYQNAKKATGMECSTQNDLAGTYTADFRGLIGAEIGFLHCYKRPGFLCPDDGDEEFLVVG